MLKASSQLLHDRSHIPSLSFMHVASEVWGRMAASCANLCHNPANCMHPSPGWANLTWPGPPIVIRSFHYQQTPKIVGRISQTCQLQVQSGHSLACLTPRHGIYKDLAQEGCGDDIRGGLGVQLTMVRVPIQVQPNTCSYIINEFVNELQFLPLLQFLHLLPLFL